MTPNRSCPTLLTVILAATLVACQSGNSDRTAITNVTVIDAEQGVREAQTVIFAGDEIVSVQPASRRVNAAMQIDGSGKFLIPGLWDMHVHLTYDDQLTDVMPRMFLQYGVTSVRDTGGLLDKIVPVVTEMRQPDAIAPRVYFSGPLMDGTHVVYDGKSVPEIGISNQSEESARQNVQRLKDAGADFVKIYEMVSPEVFVAISDAALERNMPIASHVPLSMTASSAAAHVDSMEHLRNVELDCAANGDELLQTRLEMLENSEGLSGHALRGSIHTEQRIPASTAYDEARCQGVIENLLDVIQVPTAGLNTLSIWPPWERDDWSQAVATLPGEVQQEWESAPVWYNADDNGPYVQFANYVLRTIAEMNTAGVPIGAGTDTPIGRAIPGDSLHTELEVLVKAGLTPLEAIESATVHPAAFFGIEEQMGLIRKGMVADLLLLDEDPLLDIRNTRAIYQVIYRGRVLN